MKMLYITVLATMMLSAPIYSLAQEVKRTPLPKDHPLIGSWKIELPNTTCFELYNIHQDGTLSVTSGVQAAESEFEISAIPSQKGFYKWVDKITKDNGKPDCMGSIMEVGHVATNFIALHRTGKMFVMCEKEDLNTCIGLFEQQP